MKRPLFSCVMPVKGSRPYMDAALASLRNQGLGEDLEIIIQDGGGELFECSECSIVRLKDEGVNIRWEREPDQGQSDALNKGFAKAHGEWLFWLNADDVLLPDALNRTIRTIEHSNNSLSWIAGNTVYIDKDGKGLDARWNRRWHPFLYRHMSVWTGGPSAFFRRELFEKTGGFDTSLKFVMDNDLWTRMARAGAKYEVVDFPVWGFRCHEGSLTTGGQHDEEAAAEFRSLCGKFGYGHPAFWRMMMRVTQVLDGSWARRMILTQRHRGTEVGR